MLQAIRSKASSFLVKVLFGLLIVTFGIWGIGDIFRGRGEDPTVATVGSHDITLQEMSTAVQAAMTQLQGMFNNSLTPEQAKQIGVVDATLRRLVAGALVELEVDRLHLRLGDAAVRQAIVDNPAFRGVGGGFDRNTYLQLLSDNRMSESQYEKQLRQDMLNSELADALTAGWTPPAELVDTLYRARYERRTAVTAVLPADAAGPAPTPSAAQLDSFYKAHQGDFRTPELRSFKLALLTINNVAAGITVPEDRLKQEYQSRIAEFGQPEERQLQQMLLSDEAKAKTAEADLAAGQDFAAVAKSVAGLDAKGLDLGWVKAADLPKPIADAAFALKSGGVSAPVHDGFGWHILRVAAVKPGQTKSFDEVKGEIAKSVARDMAGDRIADTANHVDDALAGGAALPEVAQKFGLKLLDIKNIDNAGKDADGKSITLPQHAQDILKTAFSTDRGQTSQLTQMGEDGYYVVAVDDITPAAEKPLAAVHDRAVKLWQAEQQSAALVKLADEIAKEVNGGKSFKEVAAAHKLTLATTQPLLRSGSDKTVPPTLIGKIFDAKPGQAVAGADGDSAMIAQLTTVTAANPATDANTVKQLSQSLQNTMDNDLLGEFDQMLRRKFPVEVNQANLDRVL